MPVSPLYGSGPELARYFTYSLPSKADFQFYSPLKLLGLGEERVRGKGGGIGGT
jgi:hypothetical protein